MDMMSWVWAGILALSIGFSLLTGNGSALSGAISSGAQEGIELGLRISGAICLWSGVGKLLELAGVTDVLGYALRPLLGAIFPSSRSDRALRRSLSGNVCANFLGLGNAATPMGIAAARRMARDGAASDELCRLIVLNTASIQFLPTTVAAVRASLGCASPFDILPAVWVTSLSSAGMGLLSAYALGKLWRT